MFRRGFFKAIVGAIGFGVIPGNRATTRLLSFGGGRIPLKKILVIGRDPARASHILGVIARYREACFELEFKRLEEAFWGPPKPIDKHWKMSRVGDPGKFEILADPEKQAAMITNGEGESTRAVV